MLFKLYLSIATLLIALPAFGLPRASKPVPTTVSITNVRVIDGDTISGTINNVVTKVRLCGIDAPERKQLLGSDTTALLAQLIKDKDLSIIIVGRDRYFRTIASLYAEGRSVQQQLAISGSAYFYSSTGSCPDKQLIIDGHNFARFQKLGMHAIPGFLAPWDFRNQAKLKSTINHVQIYTD